MRRTPLLLSAILCLFIYCSAKADTFTLTSGSASTGFDHSGLTASGPNISIQANSGGEPGNPTFATCTPSPCAPGSILNVGGVFINSNLNTGLATGTVHINGVTFPNLFFDGGLNFTGSVVLPADFVNDQPVSVPFTMQGQLIGWVPCAPPFSGLRCTQVFDITLTGSGIATANFQFFGTRSVVYTFSEPVPEPATLGLLGIGLSGLFTLARRRRTGANDNP